MDKYNNPNVHGQLTYLSQRIHLQVSNKDDEIRGIVKPRNVYRGYPAKRALFAMRKHGA